MLTKTTQSQFNELVNMSADELAEWLKGDASVSSGVGQEWHR